MMDPKVPAVEESADAIAGTCCACGYAGAEETDCPKRADGRHCYHWWDGPAEETEMERTR